MKRDAKTERISVSHSVNTGCIAATGSTEARKRGRGEKLMRSTNVADWWFARRGRSRELLDRGGRLGLPQAGREGQRRR